MRARAPSGVLLWWRDNAEAIQTETKGMSPGERSHYVKQRYTQLNEAEQAAYMAKVAELLLKRQNNPEAVWW